MKFLAALCALLSTASAQYVDMGWGAPAIVGPPMMGPPLMGPPLMGPPLMGPAMMAPPMYAPSVYGAPMLASPMMGAPMGSMALLYDQDDEQATPMRRMNSNTQSGIQQHGTGNMNLQGNIQQVNRRYQKISNDVQKEVLKQRFTEGPIGLNDEVAF